MKTTHNFLTRLITVPDDVRIELRSKIKEIAQKRNIGIDSIPNPSLMEDIKDKMKKLSKEYEFKYEDRLIDFSVQNEIMISRKVLYDLFSKEGVIRMQSRSLDILSFYAYEKPWTKKLSSKINNGKNYRKASKFRISMIIAGFLLLLSVIIFMIFKINDFNEKLSGINNELNEKFIEKEGRYQVALQYFQEVFNKWRQIDYQAYDSLKILNSSMMAKIIFDRNSNFPFPPNPHNITIDFFYNEDTSPNYKFISEPGIKDCKNFPTKKAFGFGKTNCPGNCYKNEKLKYDLQPNSSILRIILPNERYIEYLTFKWVEVDGNWGSGGRVYINQNPDPIGISPYHYIGNFPPSCLFNDETVRNFKIKIDTIVSIIDIAVRDISFESEIFINEIIVYGR